MINSKAITTICFFIIIALLAARSSAALDQISKIQTGDYIIHVNAYNPIGTEVYKPEVLKTSDGANYTFHRVDLPCSEMNTVINIIDYFEPIDYNASEEIYSLEAQGYRSGCTDSKTLLRKIDGYDAALIILYRQDGTPWIYYAFYWLIGPIKGSKGTCGVQVLLSISGPWEKVNNLLNSFHVGFADEESISPEPKYDDSGIHLLPVGGSYSVSPDKKSVAFSGLPGGNSNIMSPDPNQVHAMQNSGCVSLPPQSPYEPIPALKGNSGYYEQTPMQIFANGGLIISGGKTVRCDLSDLAKCTIC